MDETLIAIACTAFVLFSWFGWLIAGLARDYDKFRSTDENDSGDHR